MVKTLGKPFYSPKSLNQVHIPSQPCAYLHSALVHANCSQSESPKLCLQLPGTHPLYSKDEKKFLKCQQSTKCPSHTSSQGLNKKVTENLSTKNAWFCPPSATCRKCSSTENTPDLEPGERNSLRIIKEAAGSCAYISLYREPAWCC